MPIHYHVVDRIARITIDRPAALNALDPEHGEALAAAFRRFRDEDDAWVAILTGAGERAFCAGADMKAFIPAWMARTRAGEPLGGAFAGITGSAFCWKPIIAAVNGVALGGGLEIVLCCDLRVATDRARFGAPEARWGFIPGAGGTQRLARAIPLARAMEMILTGEPIDAAEALRLGLINRVVPQAELASAATDLAERILRCAPLATRAAKRAVIEGLAGALDDGLALERRLLTDLLRTDDAKEGLRAFADKRAPNYLAR